MGQLMQGVHVSAKLMEHSQAARPSLSSKVASNGGGT